MDPGEFDKRVTLARDVVTGRDGAGAPVTARTGFATVWAKATHASGREFLANSGEQTERKVVFRMYPRPDMDTSVVVVMGFAAHDVQDIRTFDDVVELHTVARAEGRAA